MRTIAWPLSLPTALSERTTMRIHMTIKPIVVTARTKMELQQKIQNMGYLCCWSMGSCKDGSSYSGLRSRDTLFLFNAEKYRRRSKVNPDGSRVVTREPHWKAWVYRVPVDLFWSVKQGSRNFKFTTRTLKP